MLPFTSPRKTLQQSKYKCHTCYKCFINTHSEDTADPLPPIQPASIVDEIKYIVFKSSLMELFRKCISCCNECVGEVAYQKGTFVAIKQICSHCGHQRLWRSQPHIRDTPAGNLLLSAAILFSGATPGKTFRLLGYMGVACISDRTFYYHQSQYLQPAVLSVWEGKQHELLAECTSRCTPLSIDGDGRADSPGHSAKYGSYGIIDLSINKVLHIELVQVGLNTSKLSLTSSNRAMKSNQVTIWRRKDCPGLSSF